MFKHLTRVRLQSESRNIANKVVDIWRSPERVFLVLASVFGLIMLLVMPLFVVPDEAVHFDRAYQVGGGHFISQTIGGETGGYVPSVPTSKAVDNILPPPLAWRDYFDSISDSDVKFVPFPSSALYSPVPYLPQAVGIDIGRVLHFSLGSMVLMGRLCNLTVYILMVFLAIRIARHGKWVYVVMALFPVAIQEAASLSTDVMTIGLAFLTIATIHNLFLQKTAITGRQTIILIALAVGLGLTKQTNLTILLSLIFLPKHLFGAFWRKLIFAASVLLAGLLAAAAWYGVVKLNHYNLDYSTTLGIEKIDQVGQLKYILMHPVDFVTTVFRTYVFEGFKGYALPDFFWASMYGYFSLFLYKLPLPFIALGYASLLIALLYRGHEDVKLAGKPLVRQTAIQVLTFVVSAVAIAGALYLVWTPVGRPQVAGIQGRYFIPLIPLLIPLFVLISKWIKVTLDKPYRMGMIVSMVAIINLTAMVALTQRYFY